ncbi:site-specific integrase [bacterium]|nr:site-specific integrase [candidate division CSSED10-310 bacterium]
MKPDNDFFKHVRGFLTVYLPKNRCYSQHTVKAYRDTINLFRKFMLEERGIAFTQIHFDQIKHEVIEEFLAWLQNTRDCKASTKNHRLAALKSFFHYCAMEDPALMAIYLDVQKIRPQRVARNRVEYMSKTALKVLLEQPDPTTRCGMRNRFFMILLYDTGARIQEILDLKLKDIHLDDQTPCIYLTGKGNKTRAVPLMDKTIAHLHVYLKIFHPDRDMKNDAHLFFTLIRGHRGRMSDDNVSCFLKRYAKFAHQACSEVPLRMHAHLFRHTRAMHLYQAGIPLSYIKDFLGHVSINTTDIYASTDTSMMKAALEKIYPNNGEHGEEPIWQDNEELILKLCGLK